jgi:tetratricopeptide (TPR) repeat protein
MNPERPSPYEQLSPEAAARVDAACDGFEMAWKATRCGAAAPRLSNFLDACEGSERTVLAGELLALDRACRERYGLADRPEGAQELGAGAEAPSNCATRPQRPRADVPAGRAAEWPSIPGLVFVEVLGSGGMGVVFKARQARLGRNVAVKFLRDAHRADPEQHQRFLQEALAVARLRHPNLVQLYEFGEVPVAGGAASQPYLVLEYVSGGSLADLLLGSPQPPRAAARLVETLAGAVHYAHQQGVIHRDLKPANVLLQRAEVKGEGQTEVLRGPLPLTADLCAKVTDFGLAKFLAGNSLTHTGDVLGTPSYMAPEQAAGKAEPITAAVDVYGLGAILYEALTGRPPFTAATAEAALIQVRQDDPVPPRRLQPTVPRDLETICLKCLRKEPGRRYATARDLADDLRRFQAGEPVRARPVGTGERVFVWCRRKPAIAGLAAALVLVFLAGSAGVLWQWQRATSNAAQADKNAADYRRERDTALREKERAEHHLRMVRQRVDRLKELGNELLERPGLYRTGRDVLEQALLCYEEMLPEEWKDPTVRLEAARLFGQVAWIQHILGQADKAADTWDREARLLTTLLEEESASKDFRMELAHIHRWRGNMLRDLGKAGEAREAYRQAAKVQEELLSESPLEPRYQAELANTLLNTASLLSGRDQTEELEVLYRRILKLDRAAVDAAPEDPKFNAELALALEGQGLFFFETGRGSQAEAALRDALEIRERVLARGHKGSIERYIARNLVNLGRVLAAAGQAEEAEQCYRKAVNLLERSLDEFHESAYHRVELVRSYRQLVSLLCELDRQTEAAELRRKALEVDSEDPAVSNELAWFLATVPEPRLRDAALAVRLAEKAVAARRQSADCWNTLGVAHYRNGDDKAAVAELETAMRLRAGGNSFDWFFLAMAHWRLGDRDQARTWFDRAVHGMDKHKPQDDELRRFRAEAEAMLDEAGKR